MQISETTFTVGHNGSLKIPAAVLKEMRLLPGDHVRVAYVVKDKRQNVFQEFLLSADPLDTLTEDNKFQVPSDLLVQANIPENADLQILCLNGCLLICQDSAFSLSELSSIFERLRTAGGIASSLPIYPFHAMEQLQEFTDRFEEGTPEDEKSYFMRGTSLSSFERMMMEIPKGRDVFHQEADLSSSSVPHKCSIGVSRKEADNHGSNTK